MDVVDLVAEIRVVDKIDGETAAQMKLNDITKPWIGMLSKEFISIDFMRSVQANNISFKTDQLYDGKGLAQGRGIELVMGQSAKVTPVAPGC